MCSFEARRVKIAVYEYTVGGLQGWENVAQADLRKTSGDDFRTKLRDFGQPYTQQAVCRAIWSSKMLLHFVLNVRVFSATSVVSQN